MCGSYLTNSKESVLTRLADRGFLLSDEQTDELSDSGFYVDAVFDDVLVFSPDAMSALTDLDLVLIGDLVLQV